MDKIADVLLAKTPKHDGFNNTRYLKSARGSQPKITNNLILGSSMKKHRYNNVNSDVNSQKGLKFIQSQKAAAAKRNTI